VFRPRPRARPDQARLARARHRLRQGLLASLLHACGVAARAKRWPAGWAAAPAGVHVTGIELMPHDIKRCEIALGGAATFLCGDMRTVEFPQVDAVVIFDALHYIAPADQDAVLARVRGALKRGGVLLLRVGNASKRRRFALGQWIDRSRWRCAAAASSRSPAGRPSSGPRRCAASASTSSWCR
jgi:SAM-dependent methyltransferase